MKGKQKIVRVTVRLTGTEFSVQTMAPTLEDGIAQVRAMNVYDLLQNVDELMDDGTVVPISAWAE